MQAEGQKNVCPLNEGELPNAAPPILTDTITSGIFTQRVVISGLCHLGRGPSAMVTCSSTSVGTQAQGSILAHLTSCARSTGPEISQAFTNPALFVWKSGKDRHIYLWDPFPSQEVPTCRAFWWLMPGDVSEGTARVGAVSMSPASVGGCLKRELSRIFSTKLKITKLCSPLPFSS